MSTTAETESDAEQFALVDALALAIARAKDGDPLAPVYVVVPNPQAAQSMGRELGRRGGVVNVAFQTIGWMAEKVVNAARRDVVPARPMSKDVQRELVRLVSAEARPPLDIDSPAVLVENLVKAFNELRSRSALEIEALHGSGSPLTREILRLFAKFQQFSAHFHDERASVELATELVASAVVDSVVPVVVVVSEPPQAYELALFDELEAIGRLQLVPMWSGDQRLDDALGFSLGTALSSGQRSVPRSQRVIVAPDADIEVQIAISEVLIRSERGIPFPRMALLFPSASPYALIAHEQLRAAGIQTSGRSPTRLAQTTVGRFVLGLIDAIENDFSFESVSKWFAGAPVLDPSNGLPIPSPDWLAVARRARAFSGRPDWTKRLHGYAAETKRHPVGAEHARELARFLTPLRAWSLETKTDWAGWVDWLETGLAAYLGNAEARSWWPKGEVQAFQDVTSILTSLRQLAFLESTVDRATFFAALTDELDVGVRPARTAQGLFVGTFADAVGCSFDAVFLCGLAEGLAPPSSSGDGLLAQLRVPGQERSADVARRQFLLALQSGQERILLCPRADQRAQRERRPSAWLLQQASLIADANVDASTLLANAAGWPWFTEVPSFSGSLDAVELLPTLSLDQTKDLNDWVRSGRTASDHSDVRAGTVLARGFNAIGARLSASSSRYDGVIDAGSTPLDPGSPLSATALENWATCPFRYFLADVLGLEGAPDTSDPFRTAGKDRGLLVHEALERFIRSAKPRLTPDEKWTSDERQDLHNIADSLCQAARDSGRTPEGLLWESELRVLHDNLDAFLDADEFHRVELGVVTSPADVEVAFGPDSANAVVVERADRTPVVFRGRIDRVDRSLDGRRVIAVDYKTQRSKYFPKFDADPVAAGTKLQLGVYGEAVASGANASNLESAGSLYWFISDPEAQYPRIGVEIDDEKRERFRSVVGTMANGIEDGVFPAVPGPETWNSYENCSHCQFDSVCPSERGEAWARKQGSAEVSAFVQLSQVSADE